MNSETNRGEGAGAPNQDFAFRVYPISDSGSLKLADLWRDLWGCRWWVLIGGVLGVVAAILAILVITPRYRAELVLVPVTAEGNAAGSLASQFAGIAAMAGVTIGGQDSTAEAIATLESRYFTQKFIKEHNLLPILFQDDWDSERRAWKSSDPREIPTLWKGAERFAKKVRTVTRNAETGLYSLTIDWSDPRLATSWADALISDVNGALRAKAIEQSARNVDYLGRELAKSTELELRTAVFSLVETELTKKMLANVTKEYAFKTIGPAVLPEKAYWPNKPLFVVLGFLAGAAIGLLVKLLRSSGAARP